MWADQPPGHHIAGYLSLLPWRSHPGQEMSQALPSRGPGLRGAGGSPPMSEGLCCACTGTGWGSVPPGDLGADRPVTHPAENRIGQAATSLPKESHGGAQWQSQRPARDPVLGVGSPALGSPWPLALPLERPSLFLATPEHGAGQALLAGGTVAQPPPCQGRLGPRSLVSLAAQLSEPRGPQGPRFQRRACLPDTQLRCASLHAACLARQCKAQKRAQRCERGATRPRCLVLVTVQAGPDLPGSPCAPAHKPGRFS